MHHRPIYIPTNEDIAYLKDNNETYLYNYLIIKTIEKLIVEAKFLRHPDMPVANIHEVVHGLCWVSPNSVSTCELAKYDADLCNKLITRKTDKTINNLNFLTSFAPSVLYNIAVIESTINLLRQELVNVPQFRFTYAENALLNSIFSVDCEKFNLLPYDYLIELINIEPSYALKFEKLDNRLQKFIIGMNHYMQRYDLDGQTRYDEENAKKLIKYLHS